MPSDFQLVTVDSDQLVLFVDRHEDAFGCGVIHRVSRSASKFNFLDQVVGLSVDYCLDIAVLVGNKNALRAGSVCKVPADLKEGTCIRPASVGGMGGHYTTGMQRVDMLD